MASGRHILIIDDDALVASVYKEQLEAQGYTAEIATDGRTGFYRIQETGPDGVLLDLMLPEINGVEILKKIRAQKRFQKLPILALSNGFMVNLLNDAVEAGATKVFNKATMSPRDVVAALSSALLPMLPAEFMGTGGVPMVLPKPAASDDSDPKPAAPPVSPNPSNSLPPLRMRGETAAGDSPASESKKASSPPTPNDSEQLQADLRQRLLSNAKTVCTSLRQGLTQCDRRTAAPEQAQALAEMCRSVHSLTGNAAVSAWANLAHFSSAVEALLKELSQRPEKINASSKLTLRQAIDAIGRLVEKGEQARRWGGSKVLVVDADVICRETLRSALELADLPSIIVGDPELALKLAQENSFDLVFLDVDMPETNGYALCERIRAFPANQKTSVVFVTVLDDVEHRTLATRSGGQDFIAKPFLLVEMAVKALTYLSMKEPEKLQKAA